MNRTVQNVKYTHTDMNDTLSLIRLINNKYGANQVNLYIENKTTYIIKPISTNVTEKNS